MPTLSRILFPAVLATVSSAAFAADGSIDILSGDAVKIEFATDLRANINRPGDGFYAVVDRDPLVPDGTRLYGRILSVHMATWRRPASMDLIFYAMRSPGGERRSIEAVPMSLNDSHLSRGTNGRLVAKYTPGDSVGYTAGGAIGGLIIGGIVHRPITGTILGALIGSIAGAADQHANQDLVVAKGEHMAAVFTRDVTDTGAALPPPPPPALNRPSGWHTNEGSWHTEEGSNRHSTPPLDGPIEIRAGATALTYDVLFAPYRDKGDVLVPLESTAVQLKLDTTRHSDGRIAIDGPGGSIELAVGATSYHTDDQRSGDLPHAVVDRGGTVFVPIEVFTLVGAGPIVVNGNRVGGH